MTELFNKKDLDDVVLSGEFSLFYLSKTKCGVCSSLKPKIINIANKYNNLKQYYINLENDKTIAGQYSIFTVPAVLVYAEGKEVIREARYMSINEVEAKISRISTLIS